MFLSDADIKKALKKGELIIENFDKDRLQSASYDVLLGFDFLVFKKHSTEIIDPKRPAEDLMDKISLKSEDEAFVLHPGEFALAAILDYVGVNEKHIMLLGGKSSLARLGLIIHATAGFIDPGNALNITLELFNAGGLPIKLYPKMKIGQITFAKLETPSERPYGTKGLGSKYINARSVQASQMYKNFGKTD
jgi:dCTP deaminase